MLARNTKINIKTMNKMAAANQPTSEIDLLGLKSLSKEQRIFFASEIRKDPELWNPVHGLGGLSEKSKNGSIQGTISFKNTRLSGVKILIIDKGNQEIASGKTNQYGHYSYELIPNNYTLKLEYKGEIIETQINITKGKTSSYNYDFAYPPKEKSKAEEVTKK